MSQKQHQQEKQEQLPQILVLGPPLVYKNHEHEFAKRFQILKPWESSLPIHLFLSTYCGSIQAVLTSGLFKITADGVLCHLPSLRLIVTTSVGLNHINLHECRRRGIIIANAAGVSSEDVAELGVGLLINVLRKVPAGDRYVRTGIWMTNGHYPLGSKVGGKRIGIVGLGSIGCEVAKRLEAFGCRISYNSQREKPSVPYQFYSNVCELAANSDALIICCTLTDETRHMINKEVILALGKDGVIVNIARGAIIDEKEMIKCLINGEIGGAGLDVLENEPLVPSELYAMDNVVLTQHVGVHTNESVSDRFEAVVGNLEAFFSNKLLLTPVLNY
ncbi:D-isomer specific 2-hydroxyacid dehydrogenase, NAD-binding domain [Dillenia turbinata]|uniref:D-isomer specific 2-hydroxyacid dehydrogenase, NAD-binding domain n=1 Tax=Dillenia turbinata TaxID=194707 RepID=A0AAN8UMS2_9MAGN